jgi:hypothetical protein
VYASGSAWEPGTRFDFRRLGVSYYNGNEESKEESGRKKEEVSPSPLYRYRLRLFNKNERGRIPVRSFFVYGLKQTPSRRRRNTSPTEPLEQRTKWQ